jgi:hypothetical protein
MKNLSTLIKYDVNTGAEGAGTTPPPAAPPAAGNFYDAFPQDLKDYTLQKGFKDPAALADAYRNFEKMKGVPQDRLLTLPEKMDDDAAMSQIFEKLGKPKDGKYSFEEKADATGKDTFGEWAKKAFADANLTDAQAKKVVDAYRGMTDTIQQTSVAEQTAAAERNAAELKATWGNAYEQNLKIAQTAAQTFGATADAVAAMEAKIGTKATMEFFKGIGEKMGEAPFRQGEGKSLGFGKMDPDSAKAELSARKQDSAFMAKYTSKDTAAVKLMNDLYANAYPGQQNI